MVINQLEARQIPYMVRSIRTNRITIKVNALGKVHISVPKYSTAHEINRTIDDHMEWINDQRAKLTLPKREYADGEKYLFLGREYRLKVITSKYEKVYLEDNLMYLYSTSNDFEHKKKIVRSWLEDMMETTFSEMLRGCFEEMRECIRTYPKLLIKAYRSRWGCCYAMKNTIILNEKLIHLPPQLIRYIIIHELSHLVYPNHSHSFHALIAKFIPNETEIRRQLRNYSVFYE